MAGWPGQETCAHSPYTRRVPTESLPPILTYTTPTTNYAQKPPYFPLSTSYPTYDTFLHKETILPLSLQSTTLSPPTHPTNTLYHPHRSSKQTYPFVKPIQRIYPRSVCWNKNIQYPFPSFILHTFIQYPPIAKTPVKTVESPTGKVRFFPSTKTPSIPLYKPLYSIPKKTDVKKEGPHFYEALILFSCLYITHIFSHIFFTALPHEFCLYTHVSIYSIPFFPYNNF